MLLPDVNVLIYAHRVDAPLHHRYAEWLVTLAENDEPFALSELVASAFVRIVTNPKVFKPATPLADALAFIARPRLCSCAATRRRKARSRSKIVNRSRCCRTPGKSSSG